MSRKFVSTRRPTGGSGGASLFPFLAVLLCTMGALIMLLVIVARNVREPVEPNVAAIVKTAGPAENVLEKLTAEDVAEILEQLQMGAEEADWFAENLAETKQEFENELEEKKTRLALLEKETQKVHDEIERLAKLSRQLDGNEPTGTGELEKLKRLLEQRKKERENAELELAELQKEAAKDAKSYAIIPYRGKSGTYRRPIYIECRDDKVVLQPEGVELYLEDFQLADRPDNPFDAVLRVIRQYYLETGQIVRGTEPYPLLIVRPSGVDTYSATRRAIGSWIKEYGYELVDEDWKIEYPQPSEELKERIEKQLETSRNRMAGYLAARNAAGAAAAHQRQQYKLDHRGRVQLADGFPPNFQSGGASGGPPTGFPGGTSRRSSGRPPEPLPGASTMQTGAAGPDISLKPERQAANGTGSADDIEMPESLRSQATLPGLNGGASLSHETPPYIPSRPAGAYAAPGSPEANFPTNPPMSSEVSSGQTAMEYRPETAGSPVDPGGWNAWNPQHPAQAATGTSRSNGTAGMTKQNPSMAASTANPPQQGGGMSPLMTVSPTDRPEAVPVFSKTTERKENWALRGMTPFSAAISRPVKIQCDANKFVLTAQKGLVRPRVVPITNSVHSATDTLVGEIWDYMETWGIAGEKMYWRPVLEVTVMPGGEQRFQELKYLLRHSGLVVEKVQN